MKHPGTEGTTVEDDGSMACQNKDNSGASRLTLAELQARHPRFVVKLSPQTQTILQLQAMDMSSPEIARRVGMTSAAVRKRIERTRTALEALEHGRTFSVAALLLAVLECVTSWLPRKVGLAAIHTSSVFMPVAGAVITVAAACAAAVYAFSPPDDVSPPLGVPAIRESPVAHRPHTGSSPERQAATETPVPTTRSGRSNLHPTAPSGKIPLTPSMSAPARGHTQLTPDVEGGQQGAHEFSAGTPLGRWGIKGAHEADGPTSASVACTDQDVVTCPKARTHIESSHQSETPLSVSAASAGK